MGRKAILSTFNSKWDNIKATFKEIAEVNRLKTQLSNPDTPNGVSSMSNCRKLYDENPFFANYSSDIYVKKNFPKWSSWLEEMIGPYKEARETMERMSQKISDRIQEAQESRNWSHIPGSENLHDELNKYIESLIGGNLFTPDVQGYLQDFCT